MNHTPFKRQPMRTHYTYDPAYAVSNLDAIPAGLGCRFLVCIIGEAGVLVAKRWARKRPKLYNPGEISLAFPT